MKVSEYQRVKDHVGIARRAGKPATLTLAEWEQTIEDFNGFCAYCLERPFKLLEHFIPIRIAGTHVRNCVPACEKCNKMKKDFTGDKLVKVFGDATIQRVANYLESRINAGSTEERIPINIARPYTSKKYRTSPAHIPGPDAPYQWLTQVASDFSVNVATLRRWMKNLGIKKYEFAGDNRIFIATEDVERLKNGF